MITATLYSFINPILIKGFLVYMYVFNYSQGRLTLGPGPNNLSLVHYEMTR